MGAPQSDGVFLLLQVKRRRNNSADLSAMGSYSGICVPNGQQWACSAKTKNQTFSSDSVFFYSGSRRANAVSVSDLGLELTSAAQVIRRSITLLASSLSCHSEFNNRLTRELPGMSNWLCSGGSLRHLAPAGRGRTDMSEQVPVQKPKHGLCV